MSALERERKLLVIERGRVEELQRRLGRHRQRVISLTEVGLSRLVAWLSGGLHDQLVQAKTGVEATERELAASRATVAELEARIAAEEASDASGDEPVEAHEQQAAEPVADPSGAPARRALMEALMRAEQLMACFGRAEELSDWEAKHGGAMTGSLAMTRMYLEHFEEALAEALRYFPELSHETDLAELQPDKDWVGIERMWEGGAAENARYARGVEQAQLGRRVRRALDALQARFERLEAEGEAE